MSDEISPPTQSGDDHLTFIAPPTNKPTLHSMKKITIRLQSIKTGWVDLLQCYEHLDPVPEIDVNKSLNIAEVEIKGASVQLKNVQKMHNYVCS